MRGASAKTLVGVLSRVDKVVGGGADAAELGSELFEVVTVLDQQPALRRVLTDPSLEADRKADLARSIFGSQLSDSTIDIVRAAVGGRWSSARDLVDGLEEAGVAAHVAGADDAGKLDDLEDDLFRFGRIVAGDAELRGVLTDRSIPQDAKVGLLDNLLKTESGLLDKLRRTNKSSESGKALIIQAVAARTGRFEPTLTRFGELAAARRKRMLATVRVAYALDNADRERLAAALERQYGQEVHLNVVVDPSVIGGISVEIGEDVIDGTVASRLEDARRQIGG